MVLVIALLIVSVIMFIFLIQRVGMLQVNRMLIFTGDFGQRRMGAIGAAGTRASTVGLSRGL
jgi:hypothetical protein